MKKLISMLLCLVFVALALVSCGDDEIIQPEAERPNLTLRMAIVVDDKTTAEGVAAMQKAFNDQCEVLLSTHVEFECIKASEYRERMDAIMEEVEDEKSKQNSAIEDTMADTGSTEGTEVDAENKYPAASKGQFDIVLIADEAMYEDYIKRGWIVGLDAHLNGNFKVLNTKMLASVKTAAFDTEKGDYFGIPANRAYGSYTYLVLNKAAADLYNIDPDKVTSLADAHALIASMQVASAGNGLSKWQTLYGENFSVIREKESDYQMPNVKYLSQDFTAFSFIGETYKADDSIGLVGNATNLLKNEEYVRYLTTKYIARKENWFGDGTAENFLIGLAEGDYELRYSNEDYYYCPIMLPVLERSEIFGGMLAVSKFTVNEKRSLEIIQELMTNANRADLLNIALYGDAQTNYAMEEGLVVYRNMSNYGAHPDYLFGGLREIAYPCANFGQTVNTYAHAADQIVDLAKRTPLFDEDFAAYFGKVNVDDWAAADAYSVEKYNELMASADLATFRASIQTLIDEMNAEEGFAFLEQENANNDNFKYETLGGAFYKYTRDRASNIFGKPDLGTSEETPAPEGGEEPAPTP